MLGCGGAAERHTNKGFITDLHQEIFFFPCLNQPTEAETPSVDINNAVPRRDLIPAVFEQLTRDYVCLPTRERALRPASTHPLGFPS